MYFVLLCIGLVTAAFGTLRHNVCMTNLLLMDLQHIADNWWARAASTRSLKPGFHYPSWRPELTARVDGWPVSITRKHGPCWRARVSTSRVDGPSTRPVLTVMETGHPSTRAVNTGCDNRALRVDWEYSCSVRHGRPPKVIHCRCIGGLYFNVGYIVNLSQRMYVDLLEMKCGDEDC